MITGNIKRGLVAIGESLMFVFLITLIPIMVILIIIALAALFT